jgi:hypothetical protein
MGNEQQTPLGHTEQIVAVLTVVEAVVKSLNRKRIVEGTFGSFKAHRMFGIIAA